MTRTELDRMESGHRHDLPTDYGTAFAAAIVLNAIYLVIEAGFGFVTGSLALLADAAHNLTDVAGLIIAWGAAALSRRGPTARHTYGLGRATILAALANAIAILIGVGALLWEAVQRLAAPVPVAAGTILWVAGAGIVVNAGTALLFVGGRHGDLNVRGAFLHMATDAAVSAGVVVSAAIVIGTRWTIVDPLAAILVGLLVGWAAFDLFRSAFHLSLDGVPADVSTAAVEQWLRALPGVSEVHDLHVWSLSTSSVALTAHLVMPGGVPDDDFLDRVAKGLEHEFGIAHSTIQVERGGGPECRLAPADVP